MFETIEKRFISDYSYDDFTKGARMFVQLVCSLKKSAHFIAFKSWRTDGSGQFLVL